MPVQNCVNSLNNINKSQCEAIYGQIIGMWIDQSDSGVTLENALLQATWTTKKRATGTSRMFVMFPDDVHEVTRTKEEPVYAEGNTKDRRKVRDGQLTMQFKYVNLTFCAMDRLKSFDGFSGYAYFLTKNEAIIAGGTSTQLKPVGVNIYVNEPVPPENSDDLWSIVIDVTIVPFSGYFKKAVLPFDQETNPWRPTQLTGITDVELSSVTGDVSDKIINFFAKSVCDEIEITSLTTASYWDVQDNTGASVVPSTVTCTVDGYYTLTFPSISAVAHTIALKDATTNSLDYETASTVSVTPAA